MNSRELTSADIPQLVAIENAAHINPWTKAMISDCFTENYYVWGLEQQQILIGFIIITVHVDECEVLNLCIHPDYQRLGHGRALLQFALQQAHQLGANTIFLEVRESNIAAINLYSTMGFATIDVRKNYYSGTNENAIIMKKGA